MGVKKPTWVVQTNLGKDEDIEEIRRVAGELGCGFYGIKAIPFTTALPEDFDPPEGPLIFYGSTSMTKNAWDQGYRNDVFFDPDEFEFPYWLAARGDDFLTQDFEEATLTELAEHWPEDREALFIRPTTDLKAFSGEVVEKSEFKEWVSRISHGGYSLPADLPILYATPITIAREWRFFVVNRKVIDGSQYRSYGRFNKRPEVPESAWEAAREFAQGWMPHKVCAMDIGATPEGQFGIIEFGSFNSVGFYNHDIEKVVRAVTEWRTLDYCYQRHGEIVTKAFSEKSYTEEEKAEHQEVLAVIQKEEEKFYGPILARLEAMVEEREALAKEIQDFVEKVENVRDS